MPSYAITIVSHESARHLPDCLASVALLEPSPVQVIAVDNGSSDSSADMLRRHGAVTSFVPQSANSGFAGGQNVALREARAEVVLCLNPDVIVSKDFAARALAAFEADARIGMLSGKLLRTADGFRVPEGEATIDSTGIVWTRSGRHLDRGAGEIDRGQYDRADEIFGPSGAAAFYRRSMLEDVAIEGEYFDTDFQSFREDADLAWRARLFGHAGHYEPTAIAFHERRVTPERRAALSSYVNYHSVKNRFLLRLKNEGVGMLLRNGAYEIGRDLMVLGYVLAREHSSAPALLEVLRLLPSTMKKRRLIQSRRRVRDRDLLPWFGGERGAQTQ